MALMSALDRELPHTPDSPTNDEWASAGRPRPPSKDAVLSERPSQSSVRAPLISRKPIAPLTDPNIRLQDTPASPVSIISPAAGLAESEKASIKGSEVSSVSRQADEAYASKPLAALSESTSALPFRRMKKVREQGERDSVASSTSDRVEDEVHAGSPTHSENNHVSGLTYHAFDDLPKKRAPSNTAHPTARSGSSGSMQEPRRAHRLLSASMDRLRPSSAASPGPDVTRGRALSPLGANGSDPGSPASYARDLSTARRSPASRPMSYVDLLNNVPYNQQIAPGPLLNNSSLQSVVGNAASLLDTKKTLDMYRANVKKTTDVNVQYSFAVFMVNTARDSAEGDAEAAQLITEAKHILQRLADRSFPFAQYYLADGFFSGLFNKDKPDYDRAFPLFVAASKHGHAESSYRTALCYEFGWGTAKSYPKAVQFYRTAASKNHPGAATRLGLACIRGDMGLGRDKHREGLKWLRRAQESADAQYNAAPYELGQLHLTGFGEVIFIDERYAAQLFTQSAELGHPQSNFLMGQAYENALYGCPRDAALSVHFYTGAANSGHPEAMMALCAWYMIGAEPVLSKDEREAYAWAYQAAESGLPKAEYAVGYFTEMGIGCRRDMLEANKWYVRAADKGNETARQRIAIIRAAAGGARDPVAAGMPMARAEARTKELGGKDKVKKFMGFF